MGTINWGTASRHHIPAMGLLSVLGFFLYSEIEKKFVKKDTKLMNSLISVIIPVRDDQDFLIETLESLISNIDFIYEIIIVDSSSNKNSKTVKEILDNSSIKNLKTIYKKISPAFPGAARNIGLKLASSDFIAFLDCKTAAKSNWLSCAAAEFKKNNRLMIFGSRTDVAAETFFQKLL